MIEYKNDFECANSNQYGKLYRCFVTSKTQNVRSSIKTPFLVICKLYFIPFTGT